MNMQPTFALKKPVTPGTTRLSGGAALLCVSLLLLLLPVLALSAQDAPTVVTNEPVVAASEPTVITNEPAVETPIAKQDPRPGRSFEDFQLIAERNIFDPSRKPHTHTAPPEPERPPEPKVDIIALTGTLSYAKGTFAFFDSNSSDFRKTAKVGDQIAGYTLKGIEQSQVALEHESQLLELKVGQQLRRKDQGAWEVTAGEPLNTRTVSSRSNSRRPEPSRRSISSRGANPDDNTAPPEETDGADAPNNQDETAAANQAPDDSGDGASEVLKRLLEQRKKEQAQ